MKRAVSSTVCVDREGKHPIVDVNKARPSSDFLETGIDLAKIKETLREIMHQDDAAEIIAKSADTTLNVIGSNQSPGDEKSCRINNSTRKIS